MHLVRVLIMSDSPYYSTMYVGPTREDYQPLIDWGIFSKPTPGANGRIIHYAQGKTLGGSSARNQQIYHRCVVARTLSRNRTKL
jgi:choline dehydrogenase